MENRLVLNIFGVIANILNNMDITFADEAIGGYSVDEITTRISSSVTRKGYVDVEVCTEDDCSSVEEFRVWANDDVVTRVRYLINIDEDCDKEYAYYTITEGLIPVKE